MPKRLRVCLAASGGGHLRQLLDLRPVWSRHDYFFVTEDTALGRSLEEEHPVRFVPHYGWGQAKLGKTTQMVKAAFVNFFEAARIMLRERPQVVISTGAAAVFFPVLWARMVGARIVVIESFARFEHDSLFGRMAAPLAHDFVVQSEQLARHYPNARYFDPLRVLDGPAPPKKPLLFATVGTLMPFNRLVSAVAEAEGRGLITERIVLQVGVGGMKPDGLHAVETLPFGEIQDLLRDASVVVCHGGTGSIITALREGCHVIAMPRMQRLGEHYDDHQAETVAAFEQRGLVLSAANAEEVGRALAASRTRERVMATTEPTGLIGFLNGVLAHVAAR
jgi:UDP-N-acetylglucosamine--N-acetylmuramyl-(pentapeptide) pyrophosphoryl-undecaprenol N-acetylglucosamine transferase